jgi:hypothetical protein
VASLYRYGKVSDEASWSRMNKLKVIGFCVTLLIVITLDDSYGELVIISLMLITMTFEILLLHFNEVMLFCHQLFFPLSLSSIEKFSAFQLC